MDDAAPRAAGGKEIDPLVGQVFHERFTITALLARGGMGRVYRAEQAPFGRLCAIKVLSAPPGGDDGDFQKRFFLEASTCAKLTHPNTVTIFDYGRTDAGVLYMAMEYLEGRTLQKTLSAEGPFTEMRTIHVARQICRSLREAHTLGVIHRDLKPANIFLISHGDDLDVVKVLDFGLVKSIEENADEELTQAGVFMGSPKYMAPEQIQGAHVDARTDIYALGVLLFEMMTGHAPFERSHQVHVLMAHVQEPVPALREIRPDVVVSEQLEAIIYKCLAKAADDRFSSMDEVMAALKLGNADGLATATGAAALLDSGPQGLAASGSFTNPTGEPSTSSPDVAIAQVAEGRARAHKRALIATFAAAAVVVLAVVGLTRRAPHVEAASANAENSSSVRVAAVAAVPSVVAPAAPSAAPSFAVHLDSDPSGATVREVLHDDARPVLCEATPCTVLVGADPRTLLLTRDGYDDERVRIERGGEPSRRVHLAKKQQATVVRSRPRAAPASSTPDFRPVPEIY